MTSSTPMRLWRDDRLTNHAQQLAADHLIDHAPRWAHVQGVAARTRQIAQLIDPAAEHILVSAAWLHDLGHVSTLAHSGFHALDGAEFAAAHTFPATVVELIAHHSGAWSEAIERGMIAELARYPLPPKAFLDILTYADLTIGPAGQPMTVRDRLSDILARYPRGDAVHRAIARSAPALIASCDRVKARIQHAQASTDLPGRRPYRHLEGTQP